LKKAIQRWSKQPAVTRLRDDLVEIVVSHGGVVGVDELGTALLAARGCTQDEPLRSRWAQAVARAATEVERTRSEPRLVVRRDHDRTLVAVSVERAVYAFRLGQLADELADVDPLVTPARVIERLREVPAPSGEAIADKRLVRMAAVASQHAEVSSKQELYPCGMPALRALKLAHGAIVGVPALTVEDIRERIRSRYPSALPLPDRPALDELLREAGLDLPWDMAGKGGLGCYVTSRRESASISSASDSASRRPTGSRRGEAGVVTPEEADARQFEERLQRGIQEGSFLALLVHSKYYERAAHELCVRFPVRLVDFEGLFLDVLREVTDKARVNWDLVLKTDATPDHGDWDKLLMLVGRAMPIVEESLVTGHRSLVTGHWSLVTGGDASSQGLGTNDQELGTNDQEPRTILLTYAGLLARYGQMDLLSRLSQKAGRRDGIPGLWLLLPGDQQALLDGKPVPLIGAGQRARIPESWLRNVHRGSH
jgi:hypothetical protein